MFAEAGFTGTPESGWTDEMLDEVLIAGDEAAVADRIRTVFDWGADELLATPIPAGDDPAATEERTLEAAWGAGRMKLTLEKFASVAVTANTTWVFAVLSDGEGNSTTVEIGSRPVADAVGGLVSALEGDDVGDESEIEPMLGLTPAELRREPTTGTAVSGIRTAVAQLDAMREGVSLATFLGAPQNAVNDVRSVRLYANINRSLFATERTPADFGRVAERAARAGFTTFKCAPFDEVSPPSSPDRILDDAATGLARVGAVRAAVGDDATVLVDCHSRFERDTAPIIADELAKLNVGWFEEPVQPRSDPEDLAAIARWARMPLAGGESGYGVEFFDSLLDGEAVSIVMPDIKHCGGAVEAVTIGTSAQGRGARGSRCTARRDPYRCSRADTPPPPYPTRCRWNTPCTRLTGARSCSPRLSGWRTGSCG